MTAIVVMAKLQEVSNFSHYGTMETFLKITAPMRFFFSDRRDRERDRDRDRDRRDRRDRDHKRGIFSTFTINQSVIIC